MNDKQTRNYKAYYDILNNETCNISTLLDPNYKSSFIEN